MSYYIDKKYNYLKQFSELADKLKNDITSSSSKSNNALLASQNDMNQNIKAARESKETKESELRTKYENSLKDIDATRDSALSAAKEVYEKSIERAEEEHRDERQKEITEMAKQLNEFNKNALDSIVTMAPYLRESSSSYIAPVLEAAPTLDELRTQAQSRTYLQQVLVGIHKKNYNNKVCILPAYAEWQTMNDATTATVGNMMIRYDRQTSQKQALAMVNGMIYRMLMAFPVGSLHVSIIDPASIGVQTLTKWMAGSEELYNHQVYKNSDEITQHLKMLEDMIFPIKQEFDSPREISLVQHNKNAIKHGYELVILYDPFRERPSYGDRLRKLMNSGISAGIYVMIIQSDLMKPEVLQEFDFGSFSTVINANKRTLTLQKGKIEWDKKSGEFNSAYSIECDYLPNSLEQSELIDPLDETIGNGLVPAFFGSLKEDWKKVTKSRTTINWEDWNEPYNDADRECFTHGIKVPIGINDDTKEEMYFRLENNADYIHSFVLGKTRSGKSKFLCSTISSIAMKYSPRAVQMYLFDFKDGLAFRCYLGEGKKEIKNGVEFKDYPKPAPHMRWLVTTKADNEMFLSVLRDLEQEKDRRKRIFDEYDERDIEPVNKKLLEAHKECLPRILLIVDECQDIYKSKDSKQQRIINQLFEDFARKYGAFGIHLILSSQMVPSDMTWITQISNNYILNAGDARFNQLLNSKTSRSSDDIQKRIAGMPDATGIYSTIDNAYITMFGYKNYEEAGRYIRQRAERLLGADINQFETKKWTGELDVPYCKTPASASLEFGTTTVGDSTIGTFIENASEGNVMIYGALGGEQAQKLTMRTVLTSLRGQIVMRRFVNNDADRCTIYVASAWHRNENTQQIRWGRKVENSLQDSDQILSNLSEHNYIHLVQPDELKQLLVRLNDQVEKKQNNLVLLYIIGIRELDVLKPDATIHVPKDSDSRLNSGEEKHAKWKGYSGRTNSWSDTQQKEQDNAYVEVKTIDILNRILHDGPAVGIHTVLQVGSKDELEERKISHKDFRHFIFQQASKLRMWPNGSAFDLENDIEQLPVDETTARTLYYDSANPEEEKYVIPFMLYDIVKEAQKEHTNIGQYIEETTQVKEE